MGKQSKPPKIAFPNPIFPDLAKDKKSDPSHGDRADQVDWIMADDAVNSAGTGAKKDVTTAILERKKSPNRLIVGRKMATIPNRIEGERWVTFRQIRVRITETLMLTFRRAVSNMDRAQIRCD